MEHYPSYSESELRRIIEECCNDVIFHVNNIECRVTSEVHDWIPSFEAWYGDDIKEYDSVDELMDDKFFGGKSLLDLLGTTEFWFL